MIKKGSKVFLDASCLLAALGSKTGGSFKVLKISSKLKFNLYISEIIYDETFRHLSKIKKDENDLKVLIHAFAIKIAQAPPSKSVRSYFFTTPDPADAHVLASAAQIKAKYLLSLDKKHILNLAQNITNFKIFSPGQFLAQI